MKGSSKAVEQSENGRCAYCDPHHSGNGKPRWDRTGPCDLAFQDPVPCFRYRRWENPYTWRGTGAGGPAYRVFCGGRGVLPAPCDQPFNRSPAGLVRGLRLEPSAEGLLLQMPHQRHADDDNARHDPVNNESSQAIRLQISNQPGDRNVSNQR